MIYVLFTYYSYSSYASSLAEVSYITNGSIYVVFLLSRCLHRCREYSGNPHPADDYCGLIFNLFYLPIESLILGMKSVFKHQDLQRIPLNFFFTYE